MSEKELAFLINLSPRTISNYKDQKKSMEPVYSGYLLKILRCLGRAAESIPLAFLENKVRRQGAGFNEDYRISIIEVPDSLCIRKSVCPISKDGWRNFNDYTLSQSLGDAWYNEGKTLMLKVPSAVMPETFNYVINTEHKNFSLLKLIAVTGLVPDGRIEDLLKKYSG